MQSDEGLMLGMSALKIELYCGQFTLSTQLIKPKYLETPPTDAAPQLLYILTHFTHTLNIFFPIQPFQSEVLRMKLVMLMLISLCYHLLFL